MKAVILLKCLSNRYKWANKHLEIGPGCNVAAILWCEKKERLYETENLQIVVTGHLSSLWIVLPVGLVLHCYLPRHFL